MPKAPRVPEKVVQQQIVQLLRSIGAQVWVLGTRRRQGDYHGTMQTPGIPDLWVVLPNRPFLNSEALWIEVKAEGGRLRPEQQVFREACAGACVDHIVGGLDAVLAYLVAGGWVSDASLSHARRVSMEGGA